MNQYNLSLMNKSELTKLSKSKIINMLLKEIKNKVVIAEDTKPVPAPRNYKPIPTPRKNVKQIVRNYENNIILPPLEFRDKPIPTHRIYNPRPPIPTPRTKQIIQKDKPVLAPRTKMEQIEEALKGYITSYEIDIINDEDPLVQLQKTRKDIENQIIRILKSMNGLEFIETLKITFTKQSNRDILYKTAHFNSSYKTVINNIDIAESLDMSKQEILNKVAQWVSEGSGWLIQSVDTHYLNVVKYQRKSGSSYITLPKELRNKGLINRTNEDNMCFRWCHIRHLHPKDKDPQRIKTSDKEYINKLDYSGVDFPVATKHYNKKEKQNNIRINVFRYENDSYPIYVSKEKHENCMILLLITKDENNNYVLIKIFNKLMYSQTKHKERKHFCMYCLQCFSSERALNTHKDICIQINGTQAI